MAAWKDPSIHDKPLDLGLDRLKAQRQLYVLRATLIFKTQIFFFLIVK